MVASLPTDATDSHRFFPHPLSPSPIQKSVLIRQFRGWRAPHQKNPCVRRIQSLYFGAAKPRRNCSTRSSDRRERRPGVWSVARETASEKSYNKGLECRLLQGFECFDTQILLPVCWKLYDFSEAVSIRLNETPHHRGFAARYGATITPRLRRSNINAASLRGATSVPSF